MNLDDPEEVKLFIATRETWSNGHKQIVVYAYENYAKMHGIKWQPPYYKHKPSIPFVPTQKEIDALINGCTKKLATSLLALKETGFRIGELWDCKWTDLDLEKNTIKCKAEKHGNPRQVRISAKLIQMLYALPKEQRIHIQQDKTKRTPMGLHPTTKQTSRKTTKPTTQRNTLPHVQTLPRNQAI